MTLNDDADLHALHSRILDGTEDAEDWQLPSDPEPMPGQREPRYRNAVEIASFPVVVPLGIIGGMIKSVWEDITGHKNPYPYLGDNHNGSPW